MSNPLLVFWVQLFGRRESLSRVPSQAHIESSTQASSTIFLVMRRMRAPLITLIVIFSISVVGLTLIPGVDPEGNPARISLFESFYFMSYTATTIGFGELPWPFTPGQRLWVTFAIYLSVVGWAYAIGSLLTLLQDRSFRQALALRRFTGKVTRLREPFLLVVGYGRAGELLAKAFDALGQQIVVIDESADRIDALDLGSYHADIPGLVADAANPHHLSAAGLDHPFCSGVLALTNDDETNLAVTMAAALLRPDLPVVSRTISSQIAERMQAFGTPTVINPFDRFGDHLRLALNAPASYQLLTWLEAGPGAELPDRGSPPTEGRWVMCGYGRFGREVTADLRAAGLEVTIIETVDRAEAEPGVIVGDASQPEVLAKADLDSAVGLVAGTENDTTNLSMLATARRLNPRLFLGARQNRPTSAAMFEAMQVDALLVPTEVVAHEVYAQISTPMLWRFIQEMPAKGDDWAAELIQRAAPQLRSRAAGAVEDQAGLGAGTGARRLAGRRQGGPRRPAAQPRGPHPTVAGRATAAASRPGRRADPGPRRLCWPATTSCCSPARAPSGASSRAPWSSTRPRRTCCSTSTSRPAGCGAGCPGRLRSRAGPTTARA